MKAKRRYGTKKTKLNQQSFLRKKIQFQLAFAANNTATSVRAIEVQYGVGA